MSELWAISVSSDTSKFPIAPLLPSGQSVFGSSGIHASLVVWVEKWLGVMVMDSRMAFVPLAFWQSIQSLPWLRSWFIADDECEKLGVTFGRSMAPTSQALLNPWVIESFL